ncbi:MAG: SHOCT domain-containing protein [Flavobacteriales bacterium]|nr:SHOCT domain-containing protein [Flavobacteriales bacterium]
MHMIGWIFWFIIIFGLGGFYVPVPKKMVKRDSPLDILKRSFANGDISNEEYTERKSVLLDKQ